MSSGTTSGIEANPSSLAAAESLGVFEKAPQPMESVGLCGDEDKMLQQQRMVCVIL